MKILVTGGAGFIGSHLCEKLLNTGNEVICVDNNPEIVKSLIKRKVSCVYGDVRNKEVLDSIKFRKIKTITNKKR